MRRIAIQKALRRACEVRPEKRKRRLRRRLLRSFLSVYARILGTRGLRERLSPIERTRS